MNQNQKINNIQAGLQFGLIIGLIYCTSLFIRYNQISSGPIIIGLIALGFYITILGILIYSGIIRKKELGGYISLKEAFQTMFVAVLIGELIYTLFNIIYLKYIDPNYFDKFYSSMETFLGKTIPNETQREEALEKVKQQLELQKEKGFTIKGTILGYLISVATTGVFAFICSIIIRKNRPELEISENIKQ